jgi:hypothetical protein
MLACYERGEFDYQTMLERTVLALSSRCNDLTAQLAQRLANAPWPVILIREPGPRVEPEPT